MSATGYEARPGDHFRCPLCGGSHFGRDTAARPDGVVEVMATVRCHAPGCGWRGEWPVSAAVASRTSVVRLDFYSRDARSDTARATTWRNALQSLDLFGANVPDIVRAHFRGQMRFCALGAVESARLAAHERSRS